MKVKVFGPFCKRMRVLFCLGFSILPEGFKIGLGPWVFFLELRDEN
jgi:hypothetical protein